jgi:predicted DNA-binding antitoxin AbrB/MazE fold protein
MSSIYKVSKNFSNEEIAFTTLQPAVTTVFWDPGSNLWSFVDWIAFPAVPIYRRTLVMLTDITEMERAKRTIEQRNLKNIEFEIFSESLSSRRYRANDIEGIRKYEKELFNEIYLAMKKHNAGTLILFNLLDLIPISTTAMAESNLVIRSFVRALYTDMKKINLSEGSKFSFVIITEEISDVLSKIILASSDRGIRLFRKEEENFYEQLR